MMRSISSVNWLVACALFHVTSTSTPAIAQSLTMGPPVSVAVSSDHNTAYIAGLKRAQLLRLSQQADASLVPTETWLSVAEPAPIDMQLLGSENQLLMLVAEPPALLSVSLPDSNSQTTSPPADALKLSQRLPLPDEPRRLAVAIRDQRATYACITATWDSAVYVVDLSKSNDSDWATSFWRRTLDFLPGEVLALNDKQFLVADAFGNQLAIIDAQNQRVVSTSSIHGYHIGGLTLDEQSANLLVSHQRLNRTSHTTKDDIHWGSLIENVVTTVPLLDLRSLTSNPGDFASFRLGRVGHGAGDPASIVTWNASRRAVAIAGTDEVAFYDTAKGKKSLEFVAVGRVPTKLFRFGASQLLCVHRLDSTLSVIETAGDKPTVSRTLGDSRPIATAEQQGEVDFYSARLSHENWMSCNSCHIEGHTPDLLVDTFSDQSFDSPKRIPALSNVIHTGPWSWTGAHSSLKEQVIKTLTQTMHSPAAVTEVGRDKTADNLIAFMGRFTSHATSGTTTTAPELVEQGAKLFTEHCARCHDPAQHFTTPKLYDVQLMDERGNTLFNPPSLSGLRYRRTYLHDGRERRLEDLLKVHPYPPASEDAASKSAGPLSIDNIRSLKAYLKTL